MPSAPTWHTDPPDVEARLAEIGGLTVTILHEAAIQGEIGRASCTANHPRLAGGFNAWADSTRSLRDQLLPLGWSKSDEGGYALTITPDGQQAVVVASGDEHTGSLYFQPKTRSPKGPRTQEVVAQNAVQLSLFGEDEIPWPTIAIEPTSGTVALTWLLLIHRTDEGLRIELSLPDLIGDDGRPERWPERIILPSIDFTNGPSGIPNYPDDGPEFDVDVIPLSA